MSSKNSLNCVVKLSAVVLIAATLSGCPPLYAVTMGNWIFSFSTAPLDVTYGLELDDEGTAKPYESTPGEGAMPGAWLWETNGRSIAFHQFSGGKHFVYEGELYMDDGATGIWRESDSQLVLGNWEAVLD